MMDSTLKCNSLVPTGAAYFVYDEEGHVLGEYNASGQPIYEVIWLGDQPVASVSQTRTGSAGTLAVQTSVGYIYADHLNTPRVIARSGDHAVLWRWDNLDAYGFIQPNSSYTFNLRFPGQVADKETGLFQNHHRDYDPGTGRYLQSDPIGLAGGINTYGYVGGNPVNFIDPNGLYEIPIIDDFIRDFYTGKEIACLEGAKQQWADWLRETNYTPLSQMRPSDWYIQSHAPAEIAQLAIRQGGLIGGTAAKTTLVPSGITGKSPNPQLGIGLLTRQLEA
jgi:RHS repeat-associated protein